jgi:hypothetical protein
MARRGPAAIQVSCLYPRNLLSWFWDFPDCELADADDLDKLVQQEVFVPGFFHVLDNRNLPKYTNSQPIIQIGELKL